MKLEIRPGRPSEFKALVEATTRAFGKPKDFFTTHYVHAYPGESAAKACVVAFHDGRIAGLINQTPMLLRAGRAALKACGLGGVCASPECRGQGVMSGLLKASREWQRKDGTVLGILWGARERYRRYGFEEAGRRLLVSVAARHLQDARPVPLRPATLADAPALARLARATPVGVCRTTEWQELLLRRTNFQASCNRRGPVKAFLVVEQGNPKTVVELAGDFAAARGMLKTHLRLCRADRVQLMAYPGTKIGDWAALHSECWANTLAYSGHVCIYDLGRLLRATASELASRFRAFGVARAVRVRHRDEGTCYELRPRKTGELDVRAVRGGNADLSLDSAEWVRTFFPPPAGPLLRTRADPRLLAALGFELLVPYWDRV